MGMSVIPQDESMAVNLAGGQGNRIPDLGLLLAMHAARQATAPTALQVHEADLPVILADEPDRLTLIFASNRVSPTVLHRAAGSFNAEVAALLAVGTNGEGLVHSGG